MPKKENYMAEYRTERNAGYGPTITAVSQHATQRLNRQLSMVNEAPGTVDMMKSEISVKDD